jgi:hypothetical protein
MRKFLFSPYVYINGILWLVGAIMQVGGWTNQIAAIAILGVASAWTIAFLIYWLVGRKRLRPSQERAIFGNSPSIDVKTPGPVPLWEFHTGNVKNRTLGDQIKGKHKIQIIRFVKPVEMVIREDQLPKVVNLEPKLAKRLIHFLFRTPPTIIVKKFMGEEILFDEEFTYNQDVKVEFYLTDDQL